MSTMTELDAVLAENDRLRDALADKINGETLLTELNMNQGGLNIQFEGGACHMLAEQFAQQFREMGGDNYIEMGFTARSDNMPLLVTIQRVSGKTPATLKTEAEAKLATAKNFHRSLCDRFGYSHDDRDWLRDLVSLEEFIAAKVPASADDAPPEPTELVLRFGAGLIEVGQGHHGNDRVPAILFGRNGAGTVGVETEGDREMLPGECIAALTFDNPESLDVVVEKLIELRARIWPDHPSAPA